MRIAVCMKTVVDTQGRIELDDRGKLRREHLRYDVNEYDLYAVEEALRHAETLGGRVTLVTVGADDSVQGLRKGLAMGADDAVHVATDGDLPDANATAEVLAATLGDLEPDLVLCGVESDDLGGSQVGIMLAEKLGFASACMTIGIEGFDEGKVRVRKELEGGAYMVVDVDLPAVLAIQTGINEPRYPSLKGIMAAKRKELSVQSLPELGFDGAPAPKVETVALEPPPPRERARMLEGDAEEVVDELLRILSEEEKVL